MRKTVLTLTLAALLGTTGASAKWVKVNSTDQLKGGVDYVLVGPHSNLVMTTESMYDNSLRVGAPVTVDNPGANSSIETVPDNAAILRVETVGDNYALRQTNGTEGYLYPLSASKRTLGVSETPKALTFKFLTASEAAAQKDPTIAESIFTEGDAVITNTAQSTKNILGMFKNSVGGNMDFTFQFVDQNDEPVALYANDTQSGYDLVTWTFDIKDGIVESISGFGVCCSGGTGFDISDDYDEETSLTATRNGEPIALPTSGLIGNPMLFTYAIPFTGPGKYAFTFKAGSFMVTRSNGETEMSPEMTLNLTIPSSDDAFTSDPANNSIVKEIEVITITFTDVKKVSISDDATTDDVTATLNGEPIAAPDFRAKGKTVTLVYRSAPLTAAGKYVFTIKEGVLEITNEDGTTKSNSKVEVTLNISSGNAAENWTTDPVDGAVIKTFKGYSVTFPDAVTVDLGDDASIEVTKEGETDPLSSNFVYDAANTSGKTVAFKYNPAATTALTDGKYTVTFPAGSFVINGEQATQEISTTFTIDSELVEGESLLSYYVGGMPEIYVPLDLEMSDYGMNEVFMGLNKEVKINRTCASKIELYLNDKPVASIPAANTYEDEVFAECTPGGAFGSDVVTTLSLKFGAGERVTPGKYTVKVPDDFFRSGDEILRGANFNYSIGLGTFTPDEGKTLDLKNPGDESSVVNKAGQLMQIKLNTYYPEVVVVNSAFDQEAQTGDFACPEIHIPGANATATLTYDEGDQPEVVGTFNTEDLSSVSMRNGVTTFNLRAEGNEPQERNGKYTLHMPYNFFRAQIGSDQTKFDVIQFFNGEEGDEMPEFTYSFSLTGGKDPNAPEQVFTYTPEAGSYNPYPAVTLTYPDFQSITVNEGAQATISFSSTVQTTCTLTAEGNTLTVTPDQELTTPPASEYTKIVLNIPAGSFKLDYNGTVYDNVAVNIEDIKIKDLVTCVAPVEISLPKVTDDAEAVLNVTITFPEAVSGYNSMGKAWLQKPAETETLVAEEVAEWEDWKRYKFALSSDKTQLLLTSTLGTSATAEDLVSGTTYRIYLPAGLYRQSKNGKTYQSEPYYYEFSYDTGTGADALGAESSYTVYTVAGGLVLSNAPAEALKSLAPGLYIINGKKVLVK